MIDRPTGQPVAGARVELLGANGRPLADCTTAHDGRCDLDAPAGEASLQVFSDAHLPRSVRLRLQPGTDRSLAVLLDPVEATIVVEGERDQGAPQRVVVAGEELRQVPGAMGDPIRAMEALPAVNRSNFLDGRLVVRGAEGLATSIRVDGIPVPNLFHFFVGRSVVHPALVDRIVFLPGGLPARYGEATQGVLDVETRQEAPLRPGGEVAVDLLDGSALVHASLGPRWDLVLAGRTSWVGAVIHAGTAVSAWLAGSEPGAAGWLDLAYADLAGSLSGDLGEGWRLVVGGLGSADTLRYVLPEGDAITGVDVSIGQEPEGASPLPYDEDAWLLTRWARLKVELARELPGLQQRTFVAAGPELQQNLLGIPELSGVGPFLGLVSGWTALARHEARRAAGDHLALDQGIELRWSDQVATDTSDALLEGAAGLVRTWDRQIVLGAWFAPSAQVGRTTVTPGVRTTAARWAGRTDTALEPRLAVERPVAPGWTARAFAGRYVQVPPLWTYAEGMGTPGQPLAEAFQVGAGADAALPGGWSVQVAAYDTEMGETLVEQEAMELRYDGSGWHEAPVEVLLPATGRAWGAELLVRRGPGHGRTWGWLALAAGRSWRFTESGDWPSDWDEPFSATVLLVHELSDRTRVSLRARVASGHPFTPSIGAYDPGDDAWEAVTGPPNSDRYPVFRQLDLRWERDWTRPRVDWRAYVDVLNATWADNPIAPAYTWDYSELLTVISLPIVPTVGVACRF